MGAPEVATSGWVVVGGIGEDGVLLLLRKRDVKEEVRQVRRARRKGARRLWQPGEVEGERKGRTAICLLLAPALILSRTSARAGRRWIPAGRLAGHDACGGGRLQ